MPAAPKWEPPPDPDLKNLARTAWRQWELDQPKVVAFDTETTGLAYHDQAFCATLAWPSQDIAGRPEVYGAYFEFDRIDCREAVRQIIGHADVLVAHNFKFDAHRLEAQGIAIRPDQAVHDTEAMSHLDNEHVPKGLKELAVSVLGFDDTIQVPKRRKNKDTGQMEDYFKPVPKSKYEIDKAREWAKKHHGLSSVKDVGYHLLPRGVVVPYAILDAVWTLELARVLHPRILRYTDLSELYDREMLLSRTTIYQLERAGMRVDRDYVNRMVKEYRKKVVKHELEMEAMVGKPVRSGDMPEKEKPLYFNPASDKQVAEYFTAHGFPSDSYDAEHLAAITHPLAAKLLLYRKDKKILDGYFVALQREVGEDGIFHPSLRQHGTVSGRTSAGAERGDQ